MRSAKIVVILGTLIGAIIFGIYLLFGPLLHVLVMHLVYRIWFLWVLGILGLFLIYFNRWTFGLGLISWACSALLFVGVLIVPPSMYVAQSVQPTRLEVLPDTNNVRFLPYDVAWRFAQNKVQDPRNVLGELHPLDVKGELNWASARIPNGLWNKIFGQNDGFVIINPAGDVEVVHQPMKFGEGLVSFNNIAYRLYRHRYFSDFSEIYYVRLEKEVITVAPYISWRFQLPIMVPYWGGVVVVRPDGTMEDLSPEQAQNDARLTGQRLVPESIAEYIGDGWQYRGGLWNAWFTHFDQTEIPTIQTSHNQMPYLLPTARGLKWFIAAEPYGSGSHGIFKMIYVDAHNGQVEVFELPIDSSLLGPNRASGFVKTSLPSYNWAGAFVAFEPRPVVRSGQLYWMFTVTTTEAAGIATTALVSAKDGSVLAFKDLASLLAFLSGGDAQVVVQTPQTQTETIDISKFSDLGLTKLLREIAQELDKRHR